MGCRDVPFLAIGPGILKDCSTRRPGFLRDIAHTIAWMLDFEVWYGEGRILREMFVTPPPSEDPAWQFPSVAFADGKLHVAACLKKSIGASQIYYRSSKDNGQTWSNGLCLSYPPPAQSKVLLDNIFPTIIAKDDRVSVVWSALQRDGRVEAVVRESFDGGKSWEDR